MTDGASTPTAEQLRQLRALFDAAMDVPETERDAWLDAATTWDPALRAEVRALLASDTADDRLDRLAGSLGGALRGGLATPGDDDDALAGQRLGAYYVVRLVGEGGMGAVYEARRADDQYRKRVAIKIVRHGLASELTLARFRRERQILASLEHPNIATLLDGGVTPDGRPFLVMDYVEGEPITRWCDARALPLRARLTLFRQVCGAVRHAHARLVVHRDIKPGNILVTADGTPKLLDFGIAKLLGGDDAADDALPLTRGGARAFTPEYASPEQVRGDALGTASDVYSLGVVLFELLAGRRPHQDTERDLDALERAVLTQPPPRPSAVVTDDAARARGERSADALRRRLRGELDLVALHALHVEPERRYPSAEAIDDDLRLWLDGFPIAARRDWIGYRARKFVRRNLAAVVASALVLATLVGGVITTTSQARRARAEQRKSDQVAGFLRELLSSVRPVTAGRDVPVSELLDAAARRVDAERDQPPSIRAELETVIAESDQSLGRWDEAERHLRHALALRESLDGARSTPFAVALNNLGYLYLEQGQTDRADTLFRRALALAGPAATDTLAATILDNLGSVAHARNRDAEAERLHRQALDVRRRLLGPRADMVAYSLNNVAVALGNQNRLAAAESLHRQAVAILRANHPGPYVLVADAENQLASVLDFEGKNDAADSAYRSVLAARRLLLGPEHPDYAFTAMNYAAFLFDRGRYDEAMRMSREVLALRGRSVPESHPAIAVSLQTLGRSLDQLGDTAGGGRALEESLALRRKYLPPDAWLIASSESYLGEHYTLARDFPRAERLLLHADSALRATVGAASPRVRTNGERLAKLYDAWGRADRAAAVRARLTPNA